MALTRVGDINPADLAQAGSERARNRIIAQGGKRSAADNPIRGWRHGEQALPWWMGMNVAVMGSRSRRRGSSNAAETNDDSEVGAIDLEHAVRRAVARGDMDEPLASRVLSGMVPAGPGRVRAVTPVAVGFIPLVPLLIQAGASIAAEQALKRAGRDGSPGVKIEVEAPAEAPDANACPTCNGTGRQSDAVGVASTPTVGVERTRGGFWDLIDTDGYIVRL